MDLLIPLYLLTQNNAPVNQPVFELRRVANTNTNETVVLGHSHKFTLTIYSNQALENVPVAFSFVKTEDLEINNEQNNPDLQRQFYAGTYVIPNVTVGENAYEVLLRTENSNDLAGLTGSYHVAASIDPLEIFRTRSQNDGLDIEASVNVTVDSSKLGTKDIAIENARIDNDVLVLPLTTGDNFANRFLRGSLDAQAYAGSFQNARLNFKLIAPDGTTKTADNLRVWDGEVNGFSDSFVIPFLRRDFPVNVSFALDLGSTAVESFIATHTANPGSFTFHMEVEIEGDATLENINNSRRITKSFTVIKESTTQSVRNTNNELLWETGYSKATYSGEFGSGFESSARAGLTNSQGAFARAEGRAFVRILNFNADILRGHLQLYLRPHTSSYGGDMEFQFAGARVFYRGIERGYGFSRGRDWNIHKVYQREKIKVLKIVPVRMVAGMSGTIGFAIGAELSEWTLRTESGPYTRAGAYASAAVSAFVAEAGLRANLYLLNANLNAVATAGVQISGRNVGGNLTQRATIQFIGPNGNIELYARWVSGVRMCCRRIFRRNFCIPCGLNHSTASLNVCNFQSWRFDRTLVDRRQSAGYNF